MSAVVAGSSVPGLAKEIARSLDAEFVGVATGRFPDGELHVKIDQPKLPNRVFYVQTMAPQPNERFTELLLTCDLLRELGCKEIVAVIPYLGYTRQDHRKAPGEAVSVQTFLKLLESVGIGEILSVDIHLHRLNLEDLEGLTNIKVNEVSAMSLLAKKCPLNKPIVVAPDVEATRWAESAAKAIGTEYGALEKNRITPSEVEISFGDLEVKGREILIVDDIVSTGGTMIETAQHLKQRGAKRICAAFTHAVFSSTECVAKLFNSGINELIATNTVQNEFARVNVGELLSKALS